MALAPYGVRRVRYEAERFNISERMNLTVGPALGIYVILLNAT